MPTAAHKHVQAIAKEVHSKLGSFITSEATEYSIAEKAIDLMAELGVTETWYYNVPALVLLGSRSCLSISGRDYKPATERVGDVNLVTVDLSPVLGNVWGDCARSFAVEGGMVTQNPILEEFKNGLAIEQVLHAEMVQFVDPDTTFSDLFEFSNARIKHYGFENLDFLGNVGHSIEVKTSSRRFVDSRCNELLGSVTCFTFEPHIRRADSQWGFKHEEIYYFEGGRAVSL